MTNPFLNKVASTPKPAAKSKSKKEVLTTKTELFYRELDDFWYVETKDEDVIVMHEAVWSSDAIHAGYLYSHPRNNVWDPWTRIEWSIITKDPVKLDMIFKQWLPFKPHSKVEVVFFEGKAIILKVYDNKGR